MNKRRILMITIVLIFCTSAATLVLSQQPDSGSRKIIYENLDFPTLPFVSHWIEVDGSKMHYWEIGDPGEDPILLIHGQPTWSYLWRDVIPHLRDNGRVISVDLMGFGRSDKPENAYRFVDQLAYIEQFIEALALENITLVLHDWGSGIGFDYASRHEDNVKAIAFMEAMIPPTIPFANFEVMPPGLSESFTAFRTPGVGQELLINQNIFVEEFLPMMVLRELTTEEMDAYRAPFPTPDTRLPVWRFPNELPIDGKPEDVTERILNYSRWLTETDTPMLHLYVTPGAANPAVTVRWVQENIKNVESVFLGEGLHFIQEDYPQEIGQAIADWLAELGNTES